MKQLVLVIFFSTTHQHLWVNTVGDVWTLISVVLTFTSKGLERHFNADRLQCYQTMPKKAKISLIYIFVSYNNGHLYQYIYKVILSS